MIAQIDKTYFFQRPWKLWPRLVAYALFEGRPLTTKGQFINPILRVLHRFLSFLPKLKRVQTPVFIIGTGRSGTTVLGKVLSMHRDVGFLNEPKLIWSQICADEDLIGSYSRSAPRVRLSAEDATPKKSGIMRAVAGAFLALSGASRMVDKYPELIFRTPFVMAIYPDAKFIFMSRSGWDTAASIEAWSARLGKTRHGEVHDWWGANDRKWLAIAEELVPEHDDLAPYANEIRRISEHRLRAAIEWVLCMREGFALQSQFPPEKFLHVSYESLCADPGQEINRIAQFAGLCDDPVLASYACKVLSPNEPYTRDIWPDWFAPIFSSVQNKIETTRPAFASA